MIPQQPFYLIEVLLPMALSVCFLRDYNARKSRASLALGVGFFLYAWLTNFPNVLLISFATESEKYIVLRIAAFGIVAFALALLYYGTFLLLFRQESFSRKKMMPILTVIYLVYVFTLTQKYVYDIDVILLLMQILRAPIFLVIALLFYRTYQKRGTGDPSKRISLTASVASVLLAVSYVPVGILWIQAIFRAPVIGQEPLSVPGAIFYGLQSIAWILMLYSARTPAALMGGETEPPG